MYIEREYLENIIFPLIPSPVWQINLAYGNILVFKHNSMFLWFVLKLWKPLPGANIEKWICFWWVSMIYNQIINCIAEYSPRALFFSNNVQQLMFYENHVFMKA